MRYVPHTDADVRRMLQTIGVGSVDDLFACIPEKLRLARPLDLPRAASEQEVLADFMQSGDFDRHVRRARARNAARRQAMLEAFDGTMGDRVEISGANAGIHMVVWLRGVPAHCLGDIIERAADRGVGIYPLAPYYATPPERAGLLLGYAGLTEREIREGIHRLAQAIGPRMGRH